MKKVLVANRGEIAVRIIRACREMGIGSVAVFSEADRGALHTKEADEAVLIGPPPPAESYLNARALIAAARTTGADAIHPGYGFLSENAGFAGRVEAEGLTFIGPASVAIQKLGDKLEARRIAMEASVPLVPGQTVPAADPVEAAAVAEDLGFPVIVKAAGGGGGKGMRVVRDRASIAAALEGASREASSAFGDPRVYLEKYFQRPRHVEIQVLADGAGNVLHLYERECSIQRRHQKIIEETPSTALTPELRLAMGAAAVRFARAAGYRSAGTVEFLFVPGGRFFFLEMNTRIQVEHPVTEMTTGVDLVAMQLAVARGETLSLGQSDVAPRGHSIECRIYAEDPAANFLPSPGTIRFLRVPNAPWVRFDTGVEAGSMVPIHYDPILAKLIVWGEDRQRALARMDRALADTVILGVKTPIDFLRKVLAHPEFVAGNLHTEFLSEHAIDAREEGDLALALAAAALYRRREVQAPGPAGVGAAGPPCPWLALGRWEIAGMGG